MRNPQGYATISYPDRPVSEMDTITCGHCSLIVHVQPLTDPADAGGLCKGCMKIICKKCVADSRCLPWEKQLDQLEKAIEKTAAHRSYGL